MDTKIDSVNDAARCGNCKWWGKQPPGSTWRDTEGVCGRIYEESTAPAETFNHWGDDSGLMTAADFGCVLHEPNIGNEPRR